MVAWFFAGIFFTVLAHTSLYAFFSLYLDSLGYSRTAVGLLWATGIVVEVVARVLDAAPPRFVIAKGGITSSDVATFGLRIDRAMVVGPMLPGIVSLWQPVSGPAEGIPYVVFAGNVGAPESLADVVPLLGAELLVGVCYATVGLFLVRLFEVEARRGASLELA